MLENEINSCNKWEDIKPEGIKEKTGILNEKEKETGYG